MRRTVHALLITAIVASLTACTTASPPPTELSSKNVTATIGVLADVHLLVGDEIPLTASVELSGKRTDTVVLRIEQSQDGVTWSTVDEVEDAGPRVELKSSVTADVAGALKLRTTAVTADKKADTLASSEPREAVVEDLQQVVRSFYSDLTDAYRTDTQTGITFDEQHNYPGLVDFQSQAWLDRNAVFLEVGARQAIVPAVTTLAPDPTWMLTAGSCNAAQSEPPAGRTYVVNVNATYEWDGSMESRQMDIHVTYLDGVLYHWVTCS